MAEIKIENVSKTYSSKEGTVQALKNVSLTIRSGEIYGIIGMSGAGKSTLVRCLGEVLVAGGVQNVDAEALVLELHHGRGNGNTALLLDLHPVGGGGAGVLFALDLAGLGDGSAVEEELLGEGGLTGVRVRNDSECSSALDFRLVL